MKSCWMPMKMPRPMPIRPNRTLMRKSHLIMNLSFDFLGTCYGRVKARAEIALRMRALSSDRAEDSQPNAIRGIRLVAQQVARHALLVAPVRVAEFPLEVLLFAPDDGEVLDDAARNNQQQQP